MEGNDIMTDEMFRAKVKQWCNMVREQARRNASAFTKGKSKPHTYKTGRYAGKTEYMLRNKVAVQLNNRNGDVDHVSFKIPVHGIFREYGVGNGQPRNGVFSSGKRARHTYIRRSMSDWMHNPIERNIDYFGDIVAEYYGDKMLVNFKKL